jgi:hypothetical protein
VKRERFLILTAAVLLVLFRTVVFLRHGTLAFDSDQATTGLMAKHLSELRALPLFFYGQNYMLAVDAWLTAPLFVLFGVSVAVLKLPLLLMNIALAILLVACLEREVGLSPRLSLAASIPFVLASPETSATFVNTLGGTVEPLLYVVLLWLLRKRPAWFGLVAALGCLHREFTAYGVISILVIETASGGFRRGEDWRRWGRALRVAAEVWIVIQVLKPYASAAGPGTTVAQLPTEIESNSVLNALHRICFDPALSLQGLAGLVTLHWPRLFGLEARRLSEYGLIGDSIQGIPGSAWIFGPAALFLVVRTGWNFRKRKEPWTNYRFPIYLMLVAALSAGMLAIGRCGRVDTLRYDLLSVLGAVGGLSLFFALEPRRWSRILGITIVAAWAAMSTLGHARIWAEYESRHPPVSDKELVLRNLEVRGIKYAIADYWIAYHVTFLSGETIIVASPEVPRIKEYEDVFVAHRNEAIKISRYPCDGGSLVFEGVYFCPPVD